MSTDKTNSDREMQEQADIVAGLSGIEALARVDDRGKPYEVYRYQDLTEWPLDTLANMVYRDNEAKGFHHYEKTFDKDMLLFISEIIEAFEEDRSGRGMTEVYYVEDAQGVLKPEGIPIEIADLFIRMLHFVSMHKIDLAWATAEKLNYNLTRPPKHGRKY